MNRGMLGSAAMAVLFGLALATPVLGQGLSVTFVGESGGDDVNLFLADGTWAPPGEGLGPAASVQTYLVTFDVGDETGTTWSVTPAVGARLGLDGGFVQALVGYSFKQDSDIGSTDFYGGAEDGVQASGQFQWWGSGAYGLQAIASHNFGSEYLWTRGRGTVRVVDGAESALHVGAEAGWQGETGDEDIVGNIIDPNYSAVMAGPVVQYSTDHFTGVVGGGWKMVDEDFVGPDDDDSTWYIKAELVLIPEW